MSETVKALPLSGEEVREAILFKIEESLLKTCNLRDSDAYTAFSATVEIRLRLDDYGREAKDNHVVTINVGQPEAEVTTTILDVPAAPPNQVRVDTNQDIPVEVTEGGKRFTKRVKFKGAKGKQNASRGDKPSKSASTV